jgi:transposase-like protein
VGWRKVSREGGGGGRSAEKVGVEEDQERRWRKVSREGGGGERSAEKVRSSGFSENRL